MSSLCKDFNNLIKDVKFLIRLSVLIDYRGIIMAITQEKPIAGLEIIYIGAETYLYKFYCEGGTKVNATPYLPVSLPPVPGTVR